MQYILNGATSYVSYSTNSDSTSGDDFLRASRQRIVLAGDTRQVLSGADIGNTYSHVFGI